MGVPKLIASVSLTLSDGTIVSFGPEDMAAGAHYSTSRNFTRPPRKRKAGEPKVATQTWIQHEIHFLTNRETEAEWANRAE